MATYEITSPDGKTWEVTAPDGASQEEVLAYAKKNWEQPKQEAPKTDSIGRQLGLTARSAIKGAAAIPAMMADAVGGVANTAQDALLGQGKGYRFQQQLPALEALLTRAGLPEPSNAVERIVGDTASAGFGLGATAKAGQLAPTALKQLLTSDLGKQLASATAGTAASSTTREGGGGPGAQLTAAMLAGMLPTLVPGAVRAVAPNLTQAGRNETKGQILNEAAGPRKKQVLEGLAQSKQYVPGEKVTASLAASEAKAPAFNALEQEVVGKYRSDLAKSVDDTNIGARASAVDQVGGTKDALESAIASRASQASKDYQGAFKNTVKADPALAQIFSNPFIKKEVPDAIELMKAQNKPINQNLTEFIQNVKIGLDQKLSKTGNDALSSAQKNAVQGAKNDLMAWISNKNPDFNQARENFAQASRPINQMQIGQFLKDKLASPVTESRERAGVFAQALRDAPRTIKKASGSTYENLDQVLEPKQVGLLGGVKSSLEREANVADLAKTGGQQARGILGAGFETVEPPNILHRAITITRSVLEKIGVSTKNKTLQELAVEMQDPAVTQRLMETASKDQKAAIAKVISEYSRPASAGLFQSFGQVQ